MVLTIELTERALAQLLGVTPGYVHRLVSKQDGKQISKQLGKQIKGVKTVIVNDLTTTEVSNLVSKQVSNSVSKEEIKKKKEVLNNPKKEEINKEELNLFPTSKDSSPAKTDDDFDTDAFVTSWNTFFKGTSVSLIRSLDQERKAMLLARVKQYGKDDLKVAMNNYKKSQFFAEHPQFANFGWFIRPRNFLKILEGNYNK